MINMPSQIVAGKQAKLFLCTDLVQIFLLWKHLNNLIICFFNAFEWMLIKFDNLNDTRQSKYDTCLFPLEPRWGVATVIKFIGSKPPIVAFMSSSFVPSVESATFSFLGGLYNLPIAYLATNPPTECATNEIFRKFCFLWITSST